MRTAFRPIAQLFAPIQGLGWAVLIGAIVSLAVAYPLGWIELTVPGAVFGGLFAIAALLTVGRSAFEVSLHLADRRVTVGQDAMGAFTVRNISRRRLLPARIELPIEDDVASFSLPSLGGEASHNEVFSIPTARRAVIIVGPIRSARGDPLGLINRKVEWTAPVELFVHPQVVPLAGASAGAIRDLEGQSSGAISNDDMSFHALREYVPGDDRRIIHWRSSARLGQLMVRQFEDTRRTHTALGLSTDIREYDSERDAELAVSIFASLGVQSMIDERELSALAGEELLRAGTPPRLLDHCSAVTISASGTRCADMARKVARDVPGASIVFLLTGKVPDSVELRRAAHHFSAGLRVVVFSCAVGAELETRSRGSFSQVQIGDLHDLGRALRNVGTL